MSPLPAPRHFALLPAAGVGRRMGAECPKQYLTVQGRPLLWHALRVFERHPAIARVYVVLGAADVWWSRFAWDEFGKLAVLRCGGTTRAESVRNGLTALGPSVSQQDWILVHDAARPCLTQALLSRLIDQLADDPVGGLLAVPVADTLKRAGTDGRVAATVDRAGLWAAQTPQMFRHGLLLEALKRAGDAVTDEAGAVEAMGLKPRLIEGERRNLKVTFPADLDLAARLIEGDA